MYVICTILKEFVIVLPNLFSTKVRIIFSWSNLFTKTQSIMFKTLFTVEKTVCESTEFTVLFEDYGKAKEFAFGLVQNLTEKEDEDFTH